MMQQRDINKIQTIIFLRKLLAYLLVACLFLLPSFVFASDANYIYDDVGRLIKVISEIGDVATYNYDGVGNLISITTQTISQSPPVLYSINPDIVFSNSTINVTITGANLFTTETITSDNAGIGISNVVATDTSITRGKGGKGVGKGVRSLLLTFPIFTLSTTVSMSCPTVRKATAATFLAISSEIRCHFNFRAVFSSSTLVIFFV